MNPTTIEDLLADAGIDWSRWGRGKTTKPIESFKADLSRFSSDLIRTDDGRVIYQVDRVAIETLAIFKNSVFRLEMSHEVLSFDGTVVEGEKGLRSIIETQSFKLIEPEALGRKALSEIFTIDVPAINLRRQGRVQNLREDLKHPGVWVLERFISYECLIPWHCYKPEGHIRSKPDRKIYYRWKR